MPQEEGQRYREETTEPRDRDQPLMNMRPLAAHLSSLGLAFLLLKKCGVGIVFRLTL